MTIWEWDYSINLHFKFRFLLTMQNHQIVMCLGNSMIPFTAPDIPATFRKILQPGKINHVLSTGECGILTFLKTICSSITLVRGNYSSDFLPISNVVRFNDIKIGMINSAFLYPNDEYMLDCTIARLDADILITNSDRAEATRRDNRIFIGCGDMLADNPSFCLLDIVGRTVIVYMYLMNEGVLKVEKKEFEL